MRNNKKNKGGSKMGILAFIIFLLAGLQDGLPVYLQKTIVRWVLLKILLLDF